MPVRSCPGGKSLVSPSCSDSLSCDLNVTLGKTSQGPRDIVPRDSESWPSAALRFWFICYK